MDLQFTGKTALVSASSSGIGHAIAAQLLEDGATVIVNGRSAATVDRAVAGFSQRFGAGRALPLVADFAVDGSENIARAAYPEVDILVNNMGGYGLSDFFTTSDDAWRQMFDMNVLSGIRLARAYMPGMLARKQGRVIFISSEVGVMPSAPMVNYSASKATQLSIARSLAELTRGTAVTVNSVMPGPTETDSVKTFIASVYPGVPYEEAQHRFITENRPSSLIQRLAKPEEVANVVAFVASERAAVINGSAVRAEGGTVVTMV